MTGAIDVNILLYASDAGSPLHQAASTFLARCAAGPDLIYLGWPTVMGYLRIATHPSIFAKPLAPEEAMTNIEALLGLPHVKVLGEAEGFWQIYREVARGIHARGNQVPDAHLAALLRQHGVGRLYTSDRDFRKFDFLDVRDPLA
jgi:toxin-antitoxin system PIN domain toxin